MSLAARLLVSVFRVLLGYAVASFAGALSLVAMTLIASAAKSDPELPTLALGAVFSAPFVALFVGWFALVPGAIAVAVAETCALRRWWVFALAGLAAAGWFAFLAIDGGAPPARTGSLSAILAAGLVSGLAYWAAAGRRSGAWRAVTSPV